LSRILLLLRLYPLPKTRSMKHMHTYRHADLAITLEGLVTYRTLFNHCYCYCYYTMTSTSLKKNFFQLLWGNITCMLVYDSVAYAQRAGALL
jgi:hypothetical protein